MPPCPSIAARRAGRVRGRTSAASLVYRVSGGTRNTQLLQSVIIMHFSHSGALWYKVQQHSDGLVPFRSCTTFIPPRVGTRCFVACPPARWFLLPAAPCSRSEALSARRGPLALRRTRGKVLLERRSLAVSSASRGMASPRWMARASSSHSLPRLTLYVYLPTEQ